MKISTRATLDCSIDSAWEALHTPEVFRAVSAPFTVFRTPPGGELPQRFEPGVDYGVDVWASGILPLGRQTIHLTDQVTDWTSRTVTDTGHGDSGALGQLRAWNHQMRLTARPDGRTDFHDTLSVRAGAITPLLWLAMRVMWSWRAMRLRQVTRQLDPEATRQWNQRYAGKDAMWSGRVNPSLEKVASSLSPGHAIDAGAGEGGDALWLASRGWHVTALEASSVGIFRGVSEQKRRGDEGGMADISWRVADLTEPWPVDSESADLVSLQFIHAPQQARDAIWAHALKAVAPGGRLLITGHHPEDALAGIPRPPAEMCFSDEQLRALIPSDWSAVDVQTITRTQTVGERDVDVRDVVLVATR